MLARITAKNASTMARRRCRCWLPKFEPSCSHRLSARLAPTLRPPPGGGGRLENVRPDKETGSGRRYTEHAGKPQSSPEVLTAQEVCWVLDSLHLLKYRTLFTLIYATGVRVSEACVLKTTDVDGPQGVLHIRHGKGDKASLVVLSARLLDLLGCYWKAERPPQPWLFVRADRSTTRSANCKRRAADGCRASPS